MLVKLLTDHGVQPTVVVWDRGSSGRKEVYEDYKGHRPKKPDLLAEQYPHMEPLVEAFGYTNYGVEGFEADDVIATLAEKARADGTPVTIVTGDRDALQLVGEGIKVMATSRGITETKMYDRQDVDRPLRHPPERSPTSTASRATRATTSPASPGIGDKTAAQLLQKYGDLEGVLANIDRDLRRQAQGEPDQPRRERADLEDPGHRQARRARRARPDRRARAHARPRPLREVFRDFELRDPLRRLGGGARGGGRGRDADRRGRAQGLGARARRGRRRPAQAAADEEVAIIVRAPDVPEGELLPPTRPGASRRPSPAR
jgi:DNA polymerase-1